jgi:putative FmdB family regulatory protein
LPIPVEPNQPNSPSLRARRKTANHGRTGQHAMPLYEYVCKKCGKKFAEILRIKEHDTKQIACPQCKSHAVDHVIEPFFAKTASKTGAS